jgi:glycosyltransferase involved in cell wall biosynthesis
VPPRGYGGTETVLDRLARGLQRAGHEVVLIAHPDSDCPVPLLTTQPLPPGTEIGDALYSLRHVVQAYDLIADLDLDVIHDHTLSGPLYGPHHTDIPIVTTNHSPFDAHTNPLYSVIAQHAAVIAISRAQAHGARRTVPIDAVVHHGLDVDELPLGAGDGGYLLALGRMNPAKGIHEAIDVARQAGVPLKIAAKMREPGELTYFTEMVQPRLGGDVEYLGEVGGAEKLELLCGARALLNPIRWPEPFGMVMIEALACGTPVLAYPCGAAPEIIEHGVSGLLCTSSLDMVAAVGELDSIDRAACRRRVEEAFSTQRMVQGHVEVFRRHLNRATLPSCPTLDSLGTTA